MFSTNTRGGEVFAAEQKLRELRERLANTKILEKRAKKRIKPDSLKKNNKQHEQC